MHCKNCGETIGSMSDTCLKCGKQGGAGSGYCPNCGAPTNPDSTYCGFCGTSLHTGAPENTYSGASNTAYTNPPPQTPPQGAGYGNYNQPNYNQAPPTSPPYQQQPYYQPPGAYNPQKSKVAAGLFGIFFGCFGVHNFYLGYTGKAVAQLLITLLSFFFLSWATAIWGFIEAIMILTGNIHVDGKGIPLRD